MVKAVKKRTECIDFSDLSLSRLIKFFSKYNAVEKSEFVYMVYQGDAFLTSVSYRDIAMFCEEEELEFFIRCGNIYMPDKVCFTEEEAKRIFQESKYAYHYVLAEPPKRDRDYHIFFEKNPLIEKEILNLKYAELYELLKKKRIHTYRVRIPRPEEVCQHEIFNYVLSDKWLTLDEPRKLLQKNIKKITDKDITQVIEYLPKKKARERVGHGDKKVYLVGPCLVAGWIHFEDEELAFVLSDMLSKNGFEYEIIKVLQTRTVEDSLNKILSFDLFEGDIVIFLDDLFKQNELDLKQEYEAYNGKKWIYTDIPIHTTKKGNEIIAKALLDHIISVQETKTNDGRIRRILHRKQRILRYDEEQEIAEYLESISVKFSKPDKGKGGQIGAIVMNANPFTLGHRHLVEVARADVDFLYIFVVEEDRSYFSFDDRMRMVQEGTMDIKDVAVVPSGKFIISQGTFKSYFEKEEKVNAVVDATMDVWIFAQFIAPYLGIQKRFVGEEPFDNITRQYNEQMKLLLPKFGVELVEIPRRKSEGGGVNQIISASTVRRLIEKNEWEKVAQIVPETTLGYIQNGYAKRDKRYVDLAIEAMKKYIGRCDKVIVYGTGNRAIKLMRNIDARTYEKIIFCDKKASEKEYMFENKKVISPRELYQNYQGYNILISSNIYCKEIYLELRHHGVKADRIWCTTL